MEQKYETNNSKYLNYIFRVELALSMNNRSKMSVMSLEQKCFQGLFRQKTNQSKGIVEKK